MLQAMDPPVVIEPGRSPRACVIWLHGLGADGHDFEAVVPELQLPDSLGIRFVFPHAPRRPVTINGGYVMRAWFDIKSTDLLYQPDFNGMAESQSYLEALIEQEIEQGIPLEHIVLAGFSQGGVVVLQTALQLTPKPAGVVALSTYLPEPAGEGQGLQVFLAHGTQDTVVPLSLAHQTRAELISLGADVSWHAYPMPHAIQSREIVDISSWLGARLALDQ